MLGPIISPTGQSLPFVWQPMRCDRCFGVGLRINPQGKIETCPTLTLGDAHLPLGPEALRINRAVEMLRRRKVDVDQQHFDVARTLASFSTERPCPAQELGERHFSYMHVGENRRRRAVTNAIRFLREIWFLPVGSRKDKPAGYWIITSDEDFKAWVERAAREPRTTLGTIFRLARANWPEFAEQLELGFWQDMGPEAAQDSSPS